MVPDVGAWQALNSVLPCCTNISVAYQTDIFSTETSYIFHLIIFLKAFNSMIYTNWFSHHMMSVYIYFHGDLITIFTASLQAKGTWSTMYPCPGEHGRPSTPGFSRCVHRVFS